MVCHVHSTIIKKIKPRKAFGAVPAQPVLNTMSLLPKMSRCSALHLETCSKIPAFWCLSSRLLSHTLSQPPLLGIQGTFYCFQAMLKVSGGLFSVLSA